MMNRRTLIHAAAAMAVATWVAVPQAALAHQPVRRLALRPWAAGVEKEQHIVVAIGQLLATALNAQRRAFDGRHRHARQQANARSKVQGPVIGNVGGHVGQGGTGFARGVGALVSRIVAGVEFNEGHVTITAPQWQAASARRVVHWVNAGSESAV